MNRTAPASSRFVPESPSEYPIGPRNHFIRYKKVEIEQSIPARFEEQVCKYSGQMALRSRNYCLTYDALNRLANRVARAILDRCQEDNEVIALLFNNDVPIIASALGVLKAGKIYMPVDPSFPQARSGLKSFR